jgi:hypothetical protein
MTCIAVYNGAARFNQLRLASSERGCAQANRVSFTEAGRCNYSSGNDFTHHLMLPGVAKHFASGLERFAHECNHLRFEEHARIEQGTDWHGHYLSHWLLPGAVGPAGVF